MEVRFCHWTFGLAFWAIVVLVVAVLVKCLFRRKWEPGQGESLNKIERMICERLPRIPKENDHE